MKLGTYTGRKIDLVNFSKDDIDLTDITISLSRQNRYLGHILIDWSVMKHSIFCGMIASQLGLSDTIGKLVFLHDAHEAWFQDRPTPIQKQFPDPAWEAARDRADGIIYEFFGLKKEFDDPDLKKRIKTIDQAAGVIELMCFRPTFDWNVVKDDCPAPVRKMVDTLIEMNFKVPLDLIQMSWQECCQNFYEILAVIHFEGNTGVEIIVDDLPDSQKGNDGNT